MKHFQPKIILGIMPGAKQIGISVFKKQELIFYAVKTFRKQSQTNSLKNLRKIIEELIKKYGVESIALEKLGCVQQYRSFAEIVYREMRNFLEQQNLSVFDYHSKLIRRVICGVEKPTKHNTALLLSQRYIELAQYFNVPHLWQKRYFGQLFEAVAVGLVCAIELQETTLLTSKEEGKSKTN